MRLARVVGTALRLGMRRVQPLPTGVECRRAGPAREARENNRATTRGRNPLFLRGVALSSCVMCAWPAAARADVADYLGKTVRSIRFTIDDRDTADPAITQLVSIGVGQALAMADVRQSVTHLFSL